MPDITKKTSKEIKYAGRDFDSLKKGLIEFARTYYPNTYNDFNEASPGMMFLEMAAYVGDTLNYYIDSQFKESMILHATEPRSVMSIASALGYKPKLSIPSIVDLDVYQLLPPSGSGTAVIPDMRYALNIEPGMRARSSSSVEFIVNDRVDFSIDSVYNPTQISVYSIDNTGAPNYYLAKKTVKAISAQPKTTEIEVGSTKKFFKFLLQDTDLIGIDKIVDSDGHTWYEVPYLAQDTIFESVTNTALNDPDAAVYGSEAPYLLKLKKVPRRFVTRVVEKGLEVQFGAGTSTSADEELIPIPENVGLSLPTGKMDIDASIDPTSPVFTGAYGIAPSNTTLTVTYYVGGGVKSNVPSNTISEIVGIDTSNTNLPPTTQILNSTILNSVAINNYSAAGGGRSMETIEEIRQNALMQFTTQNRAVTREDYVIRAYSMPSLYGSVSKVYIAPDEQNNIQSSEVGDKVSNPLAMNMYMLGYDDSKNLTQVNHAVKENLKTYLSQYRMLTDSINFRDAFIVNIGVNFDIIPFPNVNAHEVLLNCIEAAKNYFAIDRWQINQPIVYSDVFNALIQVSGVQTVTGIKFKNLNDSTQQYSPIAYDLQDATKNGVIYPSLDPCIFEVKFPNNDIKGRIATY
jgi:hypothetical protein